jgi:hypothetical protein
VKSGKSGLPDCVSLHPGYIKYAEPPSMVHPIRSPDAAEHNPGPNSLESERAAAFAGIGATDEGARLWVNHDHVGAAETFGIAADDLMASAR